MLTTIKGYFDAGQITLQEPAPVNVKTEVIITFLTEDRTETKPFKRKLGGLEGMVNLPDNFNDPLEDLKDYM